MKVIIKQTMEDFNDLNQRIFDQVKNIPGNKAEKWTEPIVNQTTGEVACIIEDRHPIVKLLCEAALLPTETVVEISEEDANWFPVSE